MFQRPHSHEVILIKKVLLIQKSEITISNSERFHNELVQSK